MAGFIIHLQGPMQSWADRGFGPLREAGPFPSRAAVIGIIAAAMGIGRADPRLVELHERLRVHVATAREGKVLKDYHSVESDPWRSKTLTWRDYWHDAHFVALIESEDEVLIDEAAAALEAPVYAAFLGRRSCPPAVPISPVRVNGDGPAQLVDTASAAAESLPVIDAPRWGSRPGAVHVYLEGHYERQALPPPLTGLPVYHDVRRDLLVAPRRAYINRSYTRVVVEREPAPEADPQQEHFNAAPESA